MPPDMYVTGVGMISPAGAGAEPTWQALLAGRRFVATWSAGGSHGLDDLPVAPVASFNPPAGAHKCDLASQFATAAAHEALQQSGGVRDARTLFAIGSSKLALPRDELHNSYTLFLPPYSSMIAAELSSLGGCRSVLHTSVAACSTGLMNAIRGMQMIADGDADVAVCGGTDASIHPLWMACYVRMGVLGRPHPELGPAWACRPFDRTRSGFAVGEGAAVLVVESAAAMRARGGQPLARILGYATGTDPAGLTQVTSDGEPLRHVIETACRMARIEPAELVCVHAHGTGTPANDLVETRAIRAALGSAAGRVPIVSTKGAIGHLLGAAGAIELGFAALTCRDRVCPGNATLCECDPEMEGLCLPRKAFDVPAGPVLKTSLGFGGHLAAVVLGPV
jgi:3-oxoacyl-[acyl-carrier-protein] synthase II